MDTDIEVIEVEVMNIIVFFKGPFQFSIFLISMDALG